MLSCLYLCVVVFRAVCVLVVFLVGCVMMCVAHVCLVVTMYICVAVLVVTKHNLVESNLFNSYFWTLQLMVV